jgi:hypothetical protein
MKHNRNRRQGVILLVVLGLLALFTLVAITFVIVASQARRGAVIASKAQQQGTPPDVLVRRAILEVARGSHNPYSVIGPHSLLEDIYGNDGFSFVIPKSGVLTPPFVDPAFNFDGFQLNYCVGQGSMMFLDVPLANQNTGSPALPWDLVSGYFNGRIITIANGPAGGRSSRILRYEANSSGQSMTQYAVPLQNNRARLWMTPFLGMSANSAGTQWNLAGAPQPGNTFVINGAPFNGTGFGFNPTVGTGTAATGLLNYSLTVQGVPPAAGPCEHALLPNRFDPQLYDATGNYPNQCGWGGADEDYDLPDYQNMILAGISWVGGGVQPPFPSNLVQGSWNVTHPSLHRPELINYWLQRAGINTKTQYSDIPLNLRRKIVLRPEPQDHYFDGSNSGATWVSGTPDFSGHAFDPIHGPWDIDNDGDGIVDSIWVDLGMPAETAPDGTLYKPLFAFLVVDLDSRLNMNAHGNRAHYRWVASGIYQDGEFFDPREEALIGPYALRTRINYPQTGASYTNDQGYPVTASGPFAGGFPQVMVANGMGYSPAEVNLATLLSIPGNYGLWKNSLYNPSNPYNPFATWVQVPDNFGETINPYRWLLEGRTGNGRSTLVGRYGEKHLLMVDFAGPPRGGETASGYPNNMNLGAKPGITTQGLMNVANNSLYYTGDDNAPIAPMAAAHGTNILQLKGNYFTETNAINVGGYMNPSPANLIQAGHYGTYMDITGSSSIALDTRGQPLSVASASVGNALRVGVQDPNDITGTQLFPYSYGNPTVDPTTGYPKTIDDPTEIDLSRGINYQTFWYGPTGDPNQAPTNNPYSKTTDIDAPFTIAEMEVMLRQHDVDDNSLPNRLATLARSVTWDNSYANQAANPRRWATTDSWDIPSPAIIPTAEISFGLQKLTNPNSGLPYRTYNLSLLDLFRGKLAAYDIKNTGATNMASVNGRLAKMLQQQLISGDMLRGLRMDANRAFGNAWDDDGNYVVDDPNEFKLAYEVMWKNSVLNQGNGVYFDANNDGAIFFDTSNPQADNFARQQFARQLYVLLMLFKDLGYTHPQTVSVANNGQPIEVLPQGQNVAGTPTPQQALTATRLAQFAVNAVDFRDRDGIMTPFEFDLDPFNANGWRVDSILGYGSQDDTAGYRGLVWGCEAQELLLTEAVAFHDKRLKDTKYDTGPSQAAMGMPYKYPMRVNTPNAMPPFMPGDIDPDLDQYRQPQGSAFFELYAAGNGNTWGAWSGDLYLSPQQGGGRNPVKSMNGNPLVRLDNPPLLHIGKMTPANNGTQYAVWRLAISRSPLNTTRATTKENNDVRNRMAQYPDTTSLQTDLYMGFSLLKNQLQQGDPRLAGVGIERIVWLGDNPPTAGVIDYNKMYWNRNAGVSAIQPGQYAVIGPRGRTAIGRTYPMTATRVTPKPIQQQYQQYIVLNGGLPNNPLPNNPLALYQDNTATRSMYPYPVIGKDIQPTLNIIAAAAAPQTSGLAGLSQPGDPAPGLIGINISEPLPMDPAAAQIYYSAAQFFPDPDGLADGTAVNDCLGQESQMKPYPDQPFDYQQIQGKMQDPYYGTGMYDALADIKNGQYDGTRSDTIPAVKTVFLQRLANPLMPYNPGPPDPNYQQNLQINPYVTVDWLPIDLTVFNSEDPKQGTTAWTGNGDDSSPYGQARPTAAPATGERTTQPTLQFQTRQRGYPRNPSGNYLSGTAAILGPIVRPEAFNIWEPVSQDPPAAGNVNANNTLDTLKVYPQPATLGTAPTGMNFNLNLDHTLGYLNLPFHFSVPAALPSDAVNPASLTPQTSRWIDSQYLATLMSKKLKTTDGSSLAAIYSAAMGDPLRPFPWLVWNNRPFANHMELMMVPSSAPARILHEFTYRRNANVALTVNPANENHYATQYNPPAYDALGNAQPAAANYASFSHLLNFFHSSPCNAYPQQAGVATNANLPDPFQVNPPTPPTTGGVTGIPTRPLINSSGNFYRLLEFMHVPSRFSGTEDLLNPAVYQATVGAQAAADIQPFCAPFNRLSRFREPGRVNINGLRDASYGVTFQLPNSTTTQNATFSGMTLSAMLNGYPQGDWYTPLWASRQGYNVSGLANTLYQNMFTANQSVNLPTVFANPFRSYNGAYYVPLDALRRENSSPAFPYRNAIEATLLRPTPLQVDIAATAPTSIPPTTPLFAPNMVQQAYIPASNPPTIPDHARNTDRNPYFRYIGYERLGAVTTQRSNVYAGWITMGRFAVDRVAVDLAHPDGLRLVRELGSDTGDIHRRRAFFLIDRSIPVAFQRGENLNVDKCILLHRVIE